MIVDLFRDNLELRRHHYPKQMRKAVGALCQKHAADLHAAACAAVTATWREIGLIVITWPSGVPDYLISEETMKVVRRFSLDHPVLFPWRDLSARRNEHLPHRSSSGTGALNEVKDPLKE